MANQVTIETFLELRDNLTPGLMQVHNNLNRLNSTFGSLNANFRRMAASVNAMSRAFSNIGSPTQLANFRRLINLLNTTTVSRAFTGSIWRLANALHKAADNAYRLFLLLLRIRQLGPFPVPPIPNWPGGPGNIGSMFGQMVGSQLAANAIMGAARVAVNTTKEFIVKAIEVNKEYEKSISAISSAMYTMDVSPSMEVAEIYSKKVVGTLRRYAATLPGEASEYIEVFQRTIPQALMSGMRDSEKYAEFVSKYTAVAIQRGVGAKVAATNLQIMLQGTARAGTKMAQVLSAYTGKTINELNRMSREGRFALIQKAVEAASSGMGAAANKADAIFGELKTHVEDVYIIGGKPLFTAAKNSARELNEWLRTNRDSVHALSNSIATTLGDALSGSITLAKNFATTYLKMQDSTKTEESAQAQLDRLKAESAKPSKLMRFLGAFPLLGFSAKAFQFGSAVLRQGAINRLTEQVKTETELQAKLKKSAELYEPREQKLGMKLPINGTITEMADTVSEMMKKGMFDVPQTPVKDAVSDYMMSRLRVDMDKRGDIIQAVWNELIGRGTVTTATAPEAPKDRSRVYNDFRHSNFNIKQEFAEGFDPDRIAFAFASDLTRLGEMKLQAAYSLTGGSVR